MKEIALQVIEIEEKDYGNLSGAVDFLFDLQELVGKEKIYTDDIEVNSEELQKVMTVLCNLLTNKIVTKYK